MLATGHSMSSLPVMPSDVACTMRSAAPKPRSRSSHRKVRPFGIPSAAALRPTDPALLHYRSGAFYCARAQQVPGSNPLQDVILGLVDTVPIHRPVVVATGDRRVQDEARKRGASVISSDQLLNVIGRGP